MKMKMKMGSLSRRFETEMINRRKQKTIGDFFLENVKLVTIYKCCLCQKNTCQIKKLQNLLPVSVY